jgi:hypothetical protein
VSSNGYLMCAGSLVCETRHHKHAGPANRKDVVHLCMYTIHILMCDLFVGVCVYVHICFYTCVIMIDYYNCNIESLM